LQTVLSQMCGMFVVVHNHLNNVQVRFVVW